MHILASITAVKPNACHNVTCPGFNDRLRDDSNLASEVVLPEGKFVWFGPFDARQKHIT